MNKSHGMNQSPDNKMSVFERVFGRLAEWAGVYARRYSDALDREIGGPLEGEEGISALMEMAGRRPMPDGLVQRSWSRLESNIFPPLVARPALAIPYSGRREAFRPAFCRARTGLLMAMALSVAGFTAVVGKSEWSRQQARSEARQMSLAWADAETFVAAAQVTSNVPGEQFNWSIVESLLPDKQIQLTWKSVNDRSGPVVRALDGRINVSVGALDAGKRREVRLLLRTLQLTPLISDLEHAPGLQDEGSEIVLGTPCEVLAFRTPEGPGSHFGPSAGVARWLPGVWSSGRVWVSRTSHLPVQWEWYHPGGALALSVRYSRFEPNQAVS